MSIDELVAVFREKYPDATDEHVEGYRQACEAEAANPPAPVVEPDVLMPVITVPTAKPPPPLTTYTSWVNPAFYAPQLESLATKSPSAGDLRDELKEVLLGTYGLNLRLSPDVQHRIRTGNLSENELLELVFQYT